MSTVTNDRMTIDYAKLSDALKQRARKLRSIGPEEDKLRKLWGYSEIQWQLKALYSEMLHERLEVELYDQDETSTGLTLKQLMEKYPDVSEEVLCELAKMAGVEDLWERVNSGILNEKPTCWESPYEKLETMLLHIG